MKLTIFFVSKTTYQGATLAASSYAAKIPSRHTHLMEDR